MLAHIVAVHITILELHFRVVFHVVHQPAKREMARERPIRFAKLWQARFRNKQMYTVPDLYIVVSFKTRQKCVVPGDKLNKPEHKSQQNSTTEHFRPRVSNAVAPILVVFHTSHTYRSCEKQKKT